jgi:hypothetical protein
MGDESATFASGGFMFRASDDGEWENIGYIGDGGIAFSDSDDIEVWQSKLAELNQTVRIAVRPYWWSLNRLYKLVTGRYRYTVRSLRRDNKGHGRSLHAGHNRHPRH